MTHSLRNHILLLVGMVLAHPLSGQRTTVSEAEARALVDEIALQLGSSKLPGFGVEQSKHNKPSDYFFFDATWDNPDGSVVAGHYAVDRRTGDVWDSVVCREFTSRAVKRLQQAIRKRHGISQVEYRNLKKPGPMC